MSTDPGEPLCGWTIYRHPTDYPQHYAVRQWWVSDGNVHHRDVAVLCDTLDEAREHVPSGACCVGRDPDDDPVIYETWL